MKVTLTTPVRLSYCSLFTPKSSALGGAEKYGCLLMIPKSNLSATLTTVVPTSENEKLIFQAVKETFDGAVPKIFGGTIPKDGYWNHPIKDGDGVKPKSGDAYPDEFKGHWLLNVSSKNAPDVFDGAVTNRMTDPAGIKSGDYAQVQINFGAYKRESTGVSAYLSAVLKTADGEALGGNSTDTSAFKSPSLM
jgi:Protein of unknown function (DUF2815)